MENMCLIVTPEIRQLTEKILKKYPSASQRVNLTADRVRTWVESYNKSYDKNPDFVPEVEEVVADAEKKLNMDGKSFLHVVEKVVYTPTGKAQQTYTIIGNKIFNKNGEEVFPIDSKDRNKIFANLAVQNKRAVVVEYQGKKYVVNNRNQIISVTTGDEMKWGEENGDRKAILTLSKAVFEAQQKAETATTNSNAASEVKGENISSRGSEFAKLLTNPGNNVQVEYKGKTFRNAEHAYQTWKSGEFDEVAYNSTAFKPIGKKAVNKNTSYQTMVDILTAKLQQHPELIEGIAQRGGIAYLNASTHSVTGDVFWESTGQNKFLEALKEAYTNTINPRAVEGVNILGPETKININADTGENADLSNFAERPFKTWYPYHNNKPNKVNLRQGERSFVKDVETDWAFTKGNPQQRKILTLSVSDIFGGSTTKQFKTVEGAFQAAKLAFIDLENQDSPYFYYKDSLSGSARPLLTEEGKQLIKRLQEASGAEANSIGGQIKGLNKNLWDNNSSEIMKELLRLSFLQNPQALQRLLATGNATLTHTQDRSKWGTEFPKLLMEVREELRRDNPQFGNNSFQAEEQNISTTEDVYNFIKAQYPEDSSESKLTDLVFTALRSNPNIKFKKADLGEGISGKFVASENTILINNDPKYIQSNTILHEAIHAVTSYYLKASTTEGFSKEVKIAIEEIKECYALLKQDFIAKWGEEGVKITENNFDFWTNGNDTYGLKSPEEMIAELGKPSFVKHIKDFDKRHKGQNIFQKLINAVAKLFNINKSYGNLESTLKKAVATLLTNPNKELMNRYAKENATIKENVKKLKSSNHVITELRKQVTEMIEHLSRDTSTDGDEYVDTELRFNKDQIEYFKLPENVKISRFRDLHQGTIFVFENSLFFSLNGNITLNEDTVVLPVRVYSTEGLTLNNFNIKRDSYGLDYIESITPIFNAQVQTNTINQDNHKQDIVTQLIDQLKASGITVLNKADIKKYLTENGKLDPVYTLQAIKENQEMQDIKAKAIADGTFMKAPNGKPTNLTERQWLQVRTKNFIKWFGDWINDSANASKVVDENGEPLVVYRTNSRKFNGTFDTGDIYFSSDEEYTKPYARGGEEANSVSVFLNIRTPLDNRLDTYSDYGRKAILQRTGKTVNAEDYEIENKNVEEWRNSGLLNNKDGIIGNDKKNYQAEINGEKSVSDGIEYVVFNPNQIKSATDNNGEFSTENDNIQMFIGKKARTQFEHQLRKARPDLSDAEIKSTLDFLHSLEDNKENTAYIKTAIRWIANKSLTLPQDHTKAYQVFELARKKHIDLQKYNTIGELIASPEMQPKEKEKVKFNPDEAKTFSNKRTVTTKGGRVFTVYDVENTEEGQREVCKALAAHYKTSPWCLSTFTSKGEPTQSAMNYWNLYKALPRKIAYENGKPVAFNSAKYGKGIAETKFRGTPIITSGEESIIDSTEREKLARGTIDAWKQEGLVVESKILPNALRLTEKAKKEIYNTTGEAWWDMEDTHPQDKLSDSIISEPKKQQQEPPYDVQMVDLYDAAEFGFGRPGETQPITQEEIDALPFFMTPEGEVYGFVDEKGNIYLDETVISPEHPIHEYTHLWDIILAKKNPALWNKGKQLLKDKNLKLKGHEKSIWQEIEEDPNYGLKWDKTKAYYEDYVASEVHARLTGKKGLQLLDEISKQKGSKNIISKLKQWILDVYKELKATFSKWTPEELDKLTIKDFTYMTLRDFTSGMDLSTVPTILKETSDPNISKEQVNDARNTLYHIIQTSKFRIDQIQDKIKWNKATKEDIQNLNKYKAKLKEDTELLAGLDTGKSEVYINEYNTPMVRWVNKKAETTTTNLNEAVERIKAGVVQKHHGNWSRQEAQNNPRILYVFTDNTDRDSGSGVIPADSWYSKKYGAGHHFPTMTAAVVRGLDNSRPISTQRWYHQGAKGTTGRWTDTDVEEFKKIIREELQEIVNEFNTGKYDTIMFPDGDGLFNTRISAISKTRTPKLYQALADLLHEYGFDSLIPSDVKPTQQISFDISNAEFYSGAAEGSDKEWATQARALGIKVTDYTRESWNKLSQEWKDKLSSEYEEVARVLARPIIPIGNRGDIEVRRDMMQADKADAIFAIGTVVKPNEKGAKYTNKSNHDVVDGGTGYATQRGIIRGIPVYVFDQSDNRWKIWDKNSNAFVLTSEPTLTPHAATIGTRGINNSGRNAIKSILSKTTNTINSGTSSNATYGMSDAMEAFYHKAVAEKFGTNNSAQTNTQSTVAGANKPKPERPKSVTYESALKLNYSRMAQFSRTFSPQQIKDRGAMIADIFSEKIDLALGDEIDACLDIIESGSASEDEKTQAKQRYNLLRDPLYGRQTIVQEKGVDAIMKKIIQDIEISMGYAKDDKKLLYQNTLDYFTELFNTQATLDIEEREGIRITSLGVAEKTASEEAADEQDDGDDEIGHIVSGSDGWNFQVRYEDPFNSLSKKVRSMLYDIERPDTEKDDLGNTRKYSMGQIYASLLTYLAKNMHSADDFIQIDKSYEGTDHYGSNITKDMYPNGYPTFPVLEQMKNMYPWVNQLIDRLTDDYMSPDWNTDLRYPSTGGAMASQFYTNFKKAFIPYAKIQLGDNKFGVTPLNFEMEDRVQYEKLKANYNNRLILNDHSIYNADGKLNKKNAKWLQQQIKLLLPQLDYYSDFYKLLEEHAEHPEDGLLDEKTIKEHDIFIDKCRKVLNSFGIDATTDSVVAYAMIDDKLYEMLLKLEWVIENLLKVEDKDIDSFDYILDTRDKYKTNLWTHFFDGLGMITDGSYMQSFYDSASHKTKYSYSADNYLMKMFRGVCMGTLEERRQFIDEHFGKYEWFKNQDTGEWRNKWLEYWYNEPDEQRELPYKNIDNITEYGEDETIIRPYVKWTEDDIWQVQNRNYAPGSKSEFGFFLAPIFSDSPMSMTVKGPKLDMTQLLYGYNDNTGHHQGALVSLVNQELWRIGFTQRRAEEIKKGNIKAISNFDGDRGQQFCFLPELNKYTFKDTGETFLERMVSLKDRKATLDEIESSQIEAIEDIIDKKAIEYMEENDKHYKSEPIKKDAYYNMVYANAAIIQMTTVDLAFYSKDVDFQKRFKEVYAGGIELNTNSKYGKKTENVILLTDDTITSPSYDKIAAIIDNSESLSQSDKDYIKSTFTEINVADAQAIRSMHSYRSVLDMMGRWDDRMEKALQNFKNKEWKREDFDIIFQTIKPFVYAVIDRNDGFGGKIPVPQQNKNSEICALMMYDIIVNDLKDSPVYRALSRFMEETADANGEPLIDMAQFESAGKVGNQGVINISFNPNKVVNIINQGIVIDGKEFTFYPVSKDGKFLNNTVENAEKNYKEIKKDIDKDLTEGRISQKEHDKIIAYLRPTEDEIIDMLSQAALITNSDGSKSINPEVVHTIPFSNYYQQQPTPEHHIDAEATYGSQARNIAVADLPEDLEITLEGKGKNEKSFKGRDAIIDFYYELLNENLIEDFFGKGKKQGLKGIFATKENLRDAITDIVRGNPKYGRDFVDALQIDNNENFVLNPNSPTMFTLTQELITSFFKNRITKQTINGAALIQAAGIGLDDNLRIVFDDNGKLLGAQCLMPLTSKAFFEPLLEEKIINDEKVKVLNPKKLEELGLDKAVGYRIPTENKSSMMPLIITGFTPLQNGSCIVLPAEITNIAGSDFDVDKMFIMLLSFNVITHDKKKALEDYAKQEHEDAQKMINLLGKANIEDLEIDEIGGNFAEWFKKHEDEYLLKTPIIKKVEYDFSKSPKDNSRKARNNMLIQLTYKLLISKEGSESLFNPQGFADVKRAAKITRILTDTNLRKTLLKNNEALGILPPVNTIVSEFLSLVQKKYPEQYDDIKQAVSKMTAKQIQQAYLQAITAGQHGDAIQMLLNSSTKDLEKFIENNSAPESPIFPQTFAHSHARNMAGANQIGIYAIQASMAAKYQRASVRLLEKQQFTVNGRKITNVDVSDNGKRLKNLGQMIGASADNGKDPNLSDMGSTDKTAPIIGYMLRAGLNHLEAALIIKQNYMRNADYTSKKYKYWDSILGKNHLSVSVENVTTDMLIKSLISPFELTAEEKKQIAALCYRILTQHEAQEYLTQISRADSPNGSIKNTYAKARIQQYKVDLFQAKMGQKNFPFLRIKEAISNKAIDTAASEGVVREQLKAQKMGFLHGMYALGINSFSNLVAPYFFGARKKFDDVVVKPILYNLNERLSDTKKEEIINNIYTSYITFILSGTPLFGTNSTDSMKQKRDYYLESFPDDYIKIIQENEDIRKLLSSILQVNNFGSRKRIILQDVGSLSKEQKQSVQFRFESLADSENPVARQLATDLFVYSYFDNGLQFTHDSFSHLFSTRFLTNFPVYNEALQKLDEDLDESEYKNFIQQFLVTFSNAAFKVDGIITKDNLDESTDTIKINLNDKKMYNKMVNELMSPNPQFEINVYPYISYNNEIYVLDEDLFSQYPGNPTYHKLPKYATYPRLPLFSREMNITELAEEFPISESTKPSNTNNSSSDAPMAYNESDEDPSIDNSTDAAFEAMDDFIPDYDPNDIENIPISKSDTYLNEGNDELQKPMCEIIAKKFQQ